MNYRVHISAQAEEDLEDSFFYIAVTLVEPQTAANMVARLEKGIKSLHTLPDRFAKLEFEPWQGRGARRMVIGNYCVFYTVDEENKQVSVLRVVYGGRDLSALD